MKYDSYQGQDRRRRMNKPTFELDNCCMDGFGRTSTSSFYTSDKIQALGGELASHGSPRILKPLRSASSWA